jgi:signal transduction histidine kinase
MQPGWSALRNFEQMHWFCVAAPAAFVLWGVIMWQRSIVHRIERSRQRRLREEMEAYAYLDTRPGTADGLPTLGRRVCQVIAEKSHFRRVALILRNPEGRLYIAASINIEQPIEAALARWGAASETNSPDFPHQIPLGNSSLTVLLDSGDESGLRTRVIIIPVRSTGRRSFVGAIAVCAANAIGIPRSLVAESLAPLETLAVKLGRAIENAAVADRLLRAEKLAGIGMLAGGIAHALNNPLTAVMGFAELIAETNSDPSTQEDAATIVAEARRMKETVDSLLSFWRPSIQREEPVFLDALIHELAAECSATLASRTVGLHIETPPSVPAVHGNRDRLRQVLEHLLNNAAQAIAGMQVGLEGIAMSGKHAIRISLSHDARNVQLIVSDTGPGFHEPTRIFDPFYTTREPGEGTGLGLSICYGIIREHGGEISAFNLHPHGAAVVLDLPIHTATQSGHEEPSISEIEDHQIRELA